MKPSTLLSWTLALFGAIALSAAAPPLLLVVVPPRGRRGDRHFSGRQSIGTAAFHLGVSWKSATEESAVRLSLACSARAPVPTNVRYASNSHRILRPSETTLCANKQYSMRNLN